MNSSETASFKTDINLSKTLYFQARMLKKYKPCSAQQDNFEVQPLPFPVLSLRKPLTCCNALRETGDVTSSHLNRTERLWFM